MTIGYAPLEPLDRPAQFIPSRPRSIPMQVPQPLQKFMDATECNYLVMFFVVGVLGLAIKDMTSK
jgi:hypothetical protein